MLMSRLNDLILRIGFCKELKNLLSICNTRRRRRRRRHAGDDESCKFTICNTRRRKKKKMQEMKN
jgi:hypothetical protein